MQASCDLGDVLFEGVEDKVSRKFPFTTFSQEVSMNNRLNHGLLVGDSLQFNEGSHNSIKLLRQVYIGLLFMFICWSNCQVHLLVPVAVEVVELGFHQHLREGLDISESNLSWLQASVDCYLAGNHGKQAYYKFEDHNIRFITTKHKCIKYIQMRGWYPASLSVSLSYISRVFSL